MKENRENALNEIVNQRFEPNRVVMTFTNRALDTEKGFLLNTQITVFYNNVLMYEYVRICGDIVNYQKGKDNTLHSFQTGRGMTKSFIEHVTIPKEQIISIYELPKYGLNINLNQKDYEMIIKLLSNEQNFERFLKPA